MGGKGTNTVVQNSSPPAEVLKQYQDVQNAANSAAANPYYFYPGQLVAGMSPAQTGAIGATGNIAGALENPANSYGLASPYLQEAGQLTLAGAQPITSSQINQYMNPYLQQVGQTTLGEIGQNNAIQQQRLLGSAAASGALGGNRVGLAQAALANQQDLAANATLANINSQGFNTALGAAQTTAGQQLQGGFLMGQTGQMAENAGLAGLNAGLAGAQAQYGMGTAEQQQQQNQLNAAYGQWLGNVQYPFQNTNFLAGIQSGMGSLSGGTGSTSYPGPSAASQVAGLGLGGLGVAGMMGYGPLAATAATTAAATVPAAYGALMAAPMFLTKAGGRVPHASGGAPFDVAPQAEAGADPGYIGPALQITHGSGAPSAPVDPSLEPGAKAVAGFSSMPEVMRFVQGLKKSKTPDYQKEAVAGVSKPYDSSGGREPRAGGGVSQVPTPISEQILDYQEMGQLYPGSQVRKIAYQGPRGVYRKGGLALLRGGLAGGGTPDPGAKAPPMLGMQGVSSLPLGGGYNIFNTPGAGKYQPASMPGMWGNVAMPEAAPSLGNLSIPSGHPGASFAPVTLPGGTVSGPVMGSTGIPTNYFGAIEAAAPHTGWDAATPAPSSPKPSSSAAAAKPNSAALDPSMQSQYLMAMGPSGAKRGGRAPRDLGGATVIPLPGLADRPRAVPLPASLGDLRATGTDGPLAPSPAAFPVETAAQRVRAAQRSVDVLEQEAPGLTGPEAAATQRTIDRDQAMAASGAPGWSGGLGQLSAGTSGGSPALVAGAGQGLGRISANDPSLGVPLPPVGAYPQVREAAQNALQPAPQVKVPSTTPFEKAAESPWAALADAGFAMMAGTSPFPAVNIGRGLESGLGYMRQMLPQERARQELQGHYRAKNAEYNLQGRRIGIAGVGPEVATQGQAIQGVQNLPMYMGPDGRPYVIEPGSGTHIPVPQTRFNAPPGAAPLPPDRFLGLPAQTLGARFAALSSFSGMPGPLGNAAKAELTRLSGYVTQGFYPTADGGYARVPQSVPEPTQGGAPAGNFDPAQATGIPASGSVSPQQVTSVTGQTASYPEALAEARRALQSPYGYDRQAGQTWMGQYGPQVSQEQVNQLTSASNRLQNQKEQLDTLDAAVDQFLTGPTAHARMGLEKVLATTADMLGVKARQLQEGATAAQIIPKVAAFILSANARLASQSGGMGAMQMVESATPGLTNTREGIRKLSTLYKVLADRQQAMSRFVTDAVQSGQMTYNYAVNAFNVDYPPRMWASRVDPIAVPIKGGRIDTAALQPGYGYASPNGVAAVWNGQGFETGTE